MPHHIRYVSIALWVLAGSLCHLSKPFLVLQKILWNFLLPCFIFVLHDVHDSWHCLIPSLVYFYTSI